VLKEASATFGRPFAPTGHNVGELCGDFHASRKLAEIYLTFSNPPVSLIVIRTEGGCGFSFFILFSRALERGPAGGSCGPTGGSSGRDRANRGADHIRSIEVPQGGRPIAGAHLSRDRQSLAQGER
jgi:hypothetical protein